MTQLPSFEGRAGHLLQDNSRDDDSPAQSDRLEFSSGHELVSEAPGDVQHVGCLADGDHQTLGSQAFAICAVS